MYQQRPRSCTAEARSNPSTVSRSWARLRFRTNHANTSGWYSSRRVGEKYSGYKVLVEEGSDRILGAHLLGPNSDELINIFALAIRSGLRATDLKEAIYAYPTHASDIPYMV